LQESIPTREFFQKYGFVVVRDVVDSEQVTKTVDEIWSCKEGPQWEVSCVVRDDPLTWDNNNWMRKFGDVKNGFVNGFSETEVRESWNNRQNPNIYELFCNILGRDDLWVKFDRYGLMRPTKDIKIKAPTTRLIDRPEWLTVENWLHWDQNPWRQPQFKGVQGLLALSDSTENTGGFICVPGSHHIFTAWAQHYIDNSSGVEFVQISSEDPIKNFAQKITLRKGSFIIWDSRTLHANYANRSSVFRVVQYITYFPAILDSEDENEGDTKRMRVFQVRAWGFEGRYPSPQLTQLGEKLLGARDWSTGKLQIEWNPINSRNKKISIFLSLFIIAVITAVIVIKKW